MDDECVFIVVVVSYMPNGTISMNKTILPNKGVCKCILHSIGSIFRFLCERVCCCVHVAGIYYGIYI